MDTQWQGRGTQQYIMPLYHPNLCLLIAVRCFACSPDYFGKCSLLYFGLDKCLTSIFVFSVSVLLVQEFSSASVASLSVMTHTVSPATSVLRELITSQTIRRRSPLAVTILIGLVCALEHWILPAKKSGAVTTRICVMRT